MLSTGNSYHLKIEDTDRRHPGYICSEVGSVKNLEAPPL
jgi:hypothetical protein